VLFKSFDFIASKSWAVAKQTATQGTTAMWKWMGKTFMAGKRMP
jgi:hypothetical protein